jgi:hypothetical protein
VQVDSINPTSKPAGTKRLNLKYDGPLSNFAFNINLHPCSEETENVREDLALFRSDADALGAKLAAAKVHPATNCSPRQTVPLNSINEGAKCVG